MENEDGKGNGGKKRDCGEPVFYTYIYINRNVAVLNRVNDSREPGN